MILAKLEKNTIQVFNKASFLLILDNKFFKKERTGMFSLAWFLLNSRIPMRGFLIKQKDLLISLIPLKWDKKQSI